jgi:hypothetical protein
MEVSCFNNFLVYLLEEERRCFDMSFHYVCFRISLCLWILLGALLLSFVKRNVADI